MSEPLIPPHGGYRNLKSFKVARLVYDLTVDFVDRFVDRRSRTTDQMVQAARSGVQNIAEGSQASGTSKKTELKLTNVARASLEELRLDYEDFLRQRGLAQWQRNDSRRQALIDLRPGSAADVHGWCERVLRGMSGPVGPGGPGKLSGQGGPSRQGGPDGGPSTQSTPSTGLTPSTPSTPSTGSTSPSEPEALANAALALIAIATALLSRQIESQAAAFEKEGGFTERLYRVRSQSRQGRPQ